MARIDLLSAPLFVSWQLTRDCNLACLHCCTESAPGKPLPGELSREEALKVAGQIVDAGVPYTMLAGGEPLIVEHFWDIAETLGRGGVNLKIESNAQLLTPEACARLAKLPIRSIQVSLDGDTQEVYARQRPGGDLAKAHAGCRNVVASGMPLEITFAPTRINIHEAAAVLLRAAELGAFRFNTGMLMRIGTAAKLWDRLEPSQSEYRMFREMLDKMSQSMAEKIELCYLPFTIEEGLREGLASPPATLLVLPDGKVKVSAPLPYTCADLKRQTVPEAWKAYRGAWKHRQVREASEALLAASSKTAEATRFRPLEAEENDLIAA